MPQTSSAKKALRVSARRRVINDRWREKLRTLERTFKKALAAKKADEARSVLTKVQSVVDRMARRHIVHKNTAARKKSRFAALLKNLSASAKAT